jgi:hypothetical protein
MQIPFAILKSAGGSKGAALLALLAGLYIVTAMKQQQRSSANQPRP